MYAILRTQTYTDKVRQMYYESRSENMVSYTKTKSGAHKFETESDAKKVLQEIDDNTRIINPDFYEPKFFMAWEGATYGTLSVVEA